MQEQRLALPKLVEKAVKEAEEKKMMSSSTSMVCQRESILGDCVFAGGQLVFAIDFFKEYPPVSTEAMERAAAKIATTGGTLLEECQLALDATGSLQNVKGEERVQALVFKALTVLNEELKGPLVLVDTHKSGVPQPERKVDISLILSNVKAWVDFVGTGPAESQHYS